MRKVVETNNSNNNKKRKERTWSPQPKLQLQQLPLRWSSFPTTASQPRLFVRTQQQQQQQPNGDENETSSSSISRDNHQQQQQQQSLLKGEGGGDDGSMGINGGGGGGKKKAKVVVTSVHQDTDLKRRGSSSSSSVTTTTTTTATTPHTNINSGRSSKTTLFLSQHSHCKSSSNNNNMKKNSSSSSLSLKEAQQQQQQQENCSSNSTVAKDDDVVIHEKDESTTIASSYNSSCRRQQQQQQQVSKNIVHFLLQRQLQPQSSLPYDVRQRYSSSSSSKGGGGVRFVVAPWKIASWMEFQSPTKTATASTTAVQALAFDATGVLLAVAYETGLIRVFDWDMVQAADQHGRNHHYRRLHRAAASTTTTTPAAAAATAAAVLVEPILEFVVTTSSSSALSHRYHQSSKKTIACLQWHGDELAVGIRSTGAIHLYDVSAIVVDVHHFHAATTTTMMNPPPCRILTTGITAPTELSILFVGSNNHDDENDETHALVAANQQISCWDLRSSSSSNNNNSNRTTPKRKWSWSSNKNSRYITSMAVVTNDVVVLGFSDGTLALLNWKLLQRPAFSTAPSPTLLQEWSTIIRGSGSIRTAGIQNLHVDTGRQQQVGAGSVPNFDTLQGLIHLDWVTRCGWHLTTCVDIQAAAAAAAAAGKHSKHRYYATPPQVQYRTARVIYKHASTNQELKNPPITWSMPANHAKVKAAIADGSLLWEHVPQVTQILQDDNKYVLGSDGSSHFVRANDKPTLLWRDIGQQQQPSSGGDNDDGLSRIPLSKRRGQPTALAIHPNREWIVVGTKAHNIYAINARSKA